MDPEKRYSRQLPLLGEEGQRALSEAKVFIAGAGGLGSPVSIYLAAAGVGKIVLLDKDTVDLSNLNRQILHYEKDIGREKALSGAEKLSAFNPAAAIVPLVGELTQSNVSELVGDCGLIVDALDSDKTRAVLARYAFQKELPYFHAAVSGFDGQVAVFLPGKDNPCPFCLLPALTSAPQAPETSGGGQGTPDAPIPIIGAAAGVIGSMEALEVIKYITGRGDVLCGKLLIWSGLSETTDVIECLRNEECPVCSGKQVKTRKCGEEI